MSENITYQCVNCGNDAHCLLTVLDMGLSEKINDMIKCKYKANFKTILKPPNSKQKDTNE